MMKLSKSLKTYLDEARKTDSYWVEKAKLDFSISLDGQRDYAKITYAEVAKRIASSPAYISKVFRGESNLTIESMVKLARATGGQLDIRIVESAAAVSRWDLTHYKPGKAAAMIATSSVTSVKTDAANHANFNLGLAYA
jgi:transcriptional regulator with XRE-family HTH domain